MTKQAQIYEALTTLGHKEVKYPTAKYRVFERGDTRLINKFYFVGKNGGLRTGDTIAYSFSLSKDAIDRILKSAKLRKQ